MSLEQLTAKELSELRGDLARKLWQADAEIARRGWREIESRSPMSYYRKSKEQQAAIVKDLFDVLGAFDDGDPLCQDPLLAAKSMKAELRMLTYKYRMLMIEHASAIDVAGADLMREELTTCDQAAKDSLRRDIESFVEVAARRSAHVQQLQDAMRLHAEQNANFERMIAARKELELLTGVPASIIGAAGHEDNGRD